MPDRCRKRTENPARRALEPGENLELSLRAEGLPARSTPKPPLGQRLALAVLGFLVYSGAWLLGLPFLLWWLYRSEFFVIALTERRLILIAVNRWTGRSRIETACPRSEASMETFARPRGWSGLRRSRFFLTLAGNTYALNVRVGGRDEGLVNELAEQIRSYRQHLRYDLLD